MPDDFDPDEFYERYGIDVRLTGGPDNPVTIEPALSSAGQSAQADLLVVLGKMRATLDMMIVAVRDFPCDDRTFDLFDSRLGQDLAEATSALHRLRERRDCHGTA